MSNFPQHLFTTCSVIAFLIKGWQFSRKWLLVSSLFHWKNMFLQGIQLHIMSSYLSCQSVCLTHLMSTENYILANTQTHIIIIVENKTTFLNDFWFNLQNQYSRRAIFLFLLCGWSIITKGSVQNDVQCPTISLLFSDVWLYHREMWIQLKK